MRSRVLRSKAMMLVSRLPSVYLFFSSLLEFWPHRPCNVDNYFIFLQCTCFPLMTNFALFMYALYVMYVAFVSSMLCTYGGTDRTS